MIVPVRKVYLHSEEQYNADCDNDDMFYPVEMLVAPCARCGAHPHYLIQPLETVVLGTLWEEIQLTSSIRLVDIVPRAQYAAYRLGAL